MRKLTTMAAAVAMATSMAGVAEVQAQSESMSPAAWVRLAIESSQGFGGSNPTSNPSGGSGPSGDTNNPPAPGGHTSQPGTADGISYDQILDMECNGTTCMPMAQGYWLHHSNTQKNKYACAGTDLYKSTNNDPSASSPGTADDKVPLKQSAGAVMSASKSTVTETGNSTGVGQVEGPVDFQGWTFYRFSYVNFDAADPQPTQWVGCKLTWDQNDSEKAVGTYGGFMKIYAMNGNTDL